MPDTLSAFIFPAFASDFSDHPGKALPGFEEQFSVFIRSAAGTVDPALSQFSFNGTTFPADELRTQYITYIYSCTASSILRKQKFPPFITAGYSMGIYAAMFDAGVVSFGTGLELIRLAYLSLHASLMNRPYGMATIIGLSREDIQQLAGDSRLQAEITNQNASHSFVVSGSSEGIAELLELAKQEGALHTRDLGVSVPYHSGFLKEGAMDFSQKISHISFSSPGTMIISLIDQKIVETGDAMRNEVIRNLYNPLNWFTTQRIMLDLGVSVFVECGPSKGLVKNAKFVDGNYRFYALDAALHKKS